METTNRYLMTQARESLKGRWGLAVVGNAVYVILMALIQCIPTVGGIGNLILGGPLLLGWSVFFLSFSRKKEAQLSQLFDGFQHFVQSLIAYVVMAVYILLWALLLIVPGIIAALSYSQSFFILADNPQMEGMEVLRKSKALMQGHRLKLFYLFWRFFGWFLLGIVTLGIGFLWIMPYLATTLVHFYDDIRQEAGASSIPDPVAQPIQP